MVWRPRKVPWGRPCSKCLAWASAEPPSCRKSTARAFLIFKSMKLQQALGDAPRTMHQLANVVRNIKDQFYDLNYAIGKAVLPVVGKLAQYFLKLVMWTKEWVDSHKNLICGWASSGPCSWESVGSSSVWVWASKSWASCCRRWPRFCWPSRRSGSASRPWWHSSRPTSGRLLPCWV
jgi:hypothetical protein